jgi:lambda repressor-like predicted transcriptional regulator
MDNRRASIELTREALLDIVRAGLRKHSLTIKALEKKAGLSTDSVRDFLRGKTHILRADKAQKVLAILEPTLKVF